MKLPERLAAVAEFVPTGCVVADIGTDHALAPIALIERGVCRRVIATEVRPGPLRAAAQAVADSALADSIELRLGNGLAPLAVGEAEVIILAGMGGKTIIDILGAAPAVLESAQRLILQPMTESAGLRLWLCDHAWRITGEKLVREGDRLYQIIEAQPGPAQEKDPFLIALGPRLIEARDPLLPLYLGQLATRYRTILTGLRSGNSGQTREKARFLEKKLARIEEILKCLGATV